MRVHLDVYGCAVTQAEGSSIGALLERAGHSVVPDAATADAAVLVTCTVIDRTERTMVARMAELSEQVGTLVVTGCMAAAQPERVHEVAPHALVLPPQSLDQVVPVLEEGRYTPAPVDKAGLPRVVDGGLATIVINDGCQGNCSFCITKLARPGLRSYPVESIVDAVEDAVRAGAVEVRLTSMDTGAYGRDIGTDLPSLLRAVTEVSGDHRIRLGMLNPFLGLPFLDELLDVMTHPRVFRSLHVPVQSGSDAVLEHMGRQHAASDLERVARAARGRLGEVTIATDVIAGYPTETEADHRATVDLLERVRPDTVNVTRYSPRPGTPAAGLDELPGRVVKARSRELSDVRDGLMVGSHARHVGSTVEAVVTEHVKAGTSQARTAWYMPVVVDGELPVGTRVRARVVDASRAHARGEVVAAEEREPSHVRSFRGAHS